jgi:hypothetical protein
MMSLLERSISDSGRIVPQEVLRRAGHRPDALSEKDVHRDVCVSKTRLMSSISAGGELFRRLDLDVAGEAFTVVR